MSNLPCRWFQRLEEELASVKAQLAKSTAEHRTTVGQLQERCNALESENRQLAGEAAEANARATTATEVCSGSLMC